MKFGNGQAKSIIGLLSWLLLYWLRFHGISSLEPSSSSVGTSQWVCPVPNIILLLGFWKNVTVPADRAAFQWLFLMGWELFVSTFAQFICSFVSALVRGPDITDSQCTDGGNDHFAYVLVDTYIRWRLPALEPAHRFLALDVILPSVLADYQVLCFSFAIHGRSHCFKCTSRCASHLHIRRAQHYSATDRPFMWHISWSFPSESWECWTIAQPECNQWLPILSIFRRGCISCYIEHVLVSTLEKFWHLLRVRVRHFHD